MDEASVSQSTLDVCHLASCAVREEAPDAKRVAAMDLDAVYRVSERHLLASACSTALEAAGVVDDRFTQARGKAIRKVAAMDLERARLFALMDANGIWHAPLKGCVLEGVYPVYGMRQMSDNDILFDAGRAEEVRDMMASLGFSCEHFGRGAHDVYFKEPVCNFELHRMLFAPTYDERTHAYYADPLRLLVPDRKGSFGLHFTDEDFYVYVTTHAHKHYSGGGTGLRTLLDTYVFLRERGEALDWDHVRAELATLGLTEFEQMCRVLSERVFEGEGLAKADLAILAYVQDSGAYGTIAHSVAKQVARYGRAGYLLRRAFLPYDTMRTLYPVLGRMPLLLPACWVHRWGSALLTKRDKVAYQLRAALK